MMAQFGFDTLAFVKRLAAAAWDAARPSPAEALSHAFQNCDEVR